MWQTVDAVRKAAPEHFREPQAQVQLDCLHALALQLAWRCPHELGPNLPEDGEFPRLWPAAEHLWPAEQRPTLAEPKLMHYL